MKSFIKKNLKIIVLGIIVFAFAVIACFGLGNLKAPSTYYQTGELDNSNDNYDAVCYEIDYKDNTYVLDSVWINMGSLDYTIPHTKVSYDYITMYASMANTNSSYFYQTDCFTVNQEETDPHQDILLNMHLNVLVGDWQKLCAEISTTSYSYFLLCTKNTVKINELAFIGKNKTTNELALLTVSSVGAGEKYSYSGSSSPLSKSPEFATTDKAKALANKLIDEQYKFDVNKISGDNYLNDSSFLTERELYTLESVRNITTGRSMYIDASINPLGQYIIALGTSIFGGNTVGVRVMPYIFAILTILLVFFIGELLFSKSLYSLILSALVGFGGFTLALATLGTADTIFAFFILACFYFVIKFYKKGISKNNMARDLIGLLLSGVFFAIAFAVKTYAIFFLIAILVIFALGLVRQNKAYKIRLKNAIDNNVLTVKNEYYRKVLLTCVIAFMGYIILTIIITLITYLSSYSTYSTLYNNTNVLSYAFSNFKASFTQVNETIYTTNNTYPFVGYAINYGAEAIYYNKFIFGNLILTVLNLFTLIFGVVFLIVEKIDSIKVYKKEGIKTKSELFIPYLFAVLIWLVGFIFLILKEKMGISEYYIPFIANCIVSALVFGAFEKEDTKALFKIKSVSITITRLVGIIIALAILVTFALSIPAYIGVDASKNIYAWNVITHKAL